MINLIVEPIPRAQIVVGGVRWVRKLSIFGALEVLVAWRLIIGATLQYRVKGSTIQATVAGHFETVGLLNTGEVAETIVLVRKDPFLGALVGWNYRGIVHRCD